VSAERRFFITTKRARSKCSTIRSAAVKRATVAIVLELPDRYTCSEFAEVPVLTA
jgi:hypothetical protein